MPFVSLTFSREESCYCVVNIPMHAAIGQGEAVSKVIVFQELELAGIGLYIGNKQTRIWLFVASMVYILCFLGSM